jgi:hypothetical protein
VSPILLLALGAAALAIAGRRSGTTRIATLQPGRVYVAGTNQAWVDTAVYAMEQEDFPYVVLTPAQMGAALGLAINDDPNSPFEEDSELTFAAQVGPTHRDVYRAWSGWYAPNWMDPAERNTRMGEALVEVMKQVVAYPG